MERRKLTKEDLDKVRNIEGFPIGKDEDKSYYEPSELAVIPQMFPFEYDVTSEIIFGSNAFEFGNFGGSPVVIK